MAADVLAGERSAALHGRVRGGYGLHSALAALLLLAFPALRKVAHVDEMMRTLADLVPAGAARRGGLVPMSGRAMKQAQALRVVEQQARQPGKKRILLIGLVIGLPTAGSMVAYVLQRAHVGGTMLAHVSGHSRRFKDGRCKTRAANG